MLLLAPAAVWKLSKHKGDAIDLTVKETKVAQDAALRAAAVAGEAAKVSAAVNAMSSSAAASAATVGRGTFSGSGRPTSRSHSDEAATATAV